MSSPSIIIIISYKIYFIKQYTPGAGIINSTTVLVVCMFICMCMYVIYIVPGYAGMYHINNMIQYISEI